MKSKVFEAKINKVRKHYDGIVIRRMLIKCLLILALAFHLYLSFRVFLKSPTDILMLANIFRFLSLGGIIFVLVKDYKYRPGQLRISRWLDDLHGSKDDLYQNVIELKKDPAIAESDIYQRLYEHGTERINKQEVVYPPLLNPIFKKIILISLLSMAILWGLNYKQVPKSAGEYWLNRIQTTNLISNIEVMPGNLKIGRNQDVLIEVVDPINDIQYHLMYKIESQWREIAMPDAKYLFEKLDYSFSYYVQAGKVRSNTFRIDVLDNPNVKRYSLNYHYPAYTKLNPETDSTSYGNIQALRHTLVTLSIDTNIEIKEARMHFSNGTEKALQPITNKSFVTQLQVLEPLTWYMELTDALGRKSVPEEKTIDVIPDNPPEISIPEPGDDVILNQNMLLPMRIVASDDYGLKNLSLKYQVNDQNNRSQEIQGIINSANLDLDYVLSLQTLDLLPGDVVTYWAEINDNSPEQQKAVSKKYKERFPSIEEIYKEIEKQETGKKDELQDVLKQSKDLQKDFEQKRREMLKDDTMKWEDKKQLEAMVQNQQQLADQVEKVADNYQQLIDKVQNNQALSQETLEKMQKIQQILSEIDNDQLQKAMEQFSKSLKNLDPNAIKKAMENFKFSLEDFNEKIEQTLKLLESIKKEQAVEKALQISQEMEKMQKSLFDKTDDAKNSADKLAEEQKKIADKMDSIKDQLNKVDDMLQSPTDKEAKDMLDELQEMMKQDELNQDTQSSQQSLSKNERQKSKSAQAQAMQKMRKMTNKLQDMKNSMSNGSAQQTKQAMQTAVRELMIFSQKHEEAANKYKADPYPILPDLLSGYEGMQLAVNKLFANPMVMMFMPQKFFIDANQAAQSYRDFFINVNEIQYYSIPQNLDGVQKGLNLMAYDLMQALNQSSEGGGSGGGMESLMKSLQQMGQEQMAMNMLTQQMLQQMQQSGGRMGNAEQQQMQRLAGEQERLAENLKRALQNSPEAQKQGNSLKQMAEEMESVARQLKENRLDQDLVNRQERIMSKLLDAQKSINKREFSQKRKGETATENPDNPNVPSTDFNLLRKKAMLDEQYRSFPKEYQQVIQQYLKTLNEQSQK